MEDSSEDLTIAKMVQLPRLKVFDQELASWEEVNQYKNKYPIVDKNTYIGIEVETENVKRFNQYSPYWRMIEDGSLRNSGREFITPPIRAWRVEHALVQLFNHELNSDIEFSERTSIHIHMNVRTLTVPQLETLIMTYLVFEKVLFNYVGNDRYSNIFCVPIVETDIGENLLTLVTNKHPDIRWQKYTALNLLPIMQKGTIEFRHMNGTGDVERLVTWINIILCLKKFALQKSPEYIWKRINTLNTTSEYRMFAEEVFQEFLPLLWNDQFNDAVADCITYIKQFCIRNQFGIELRNAWINENQVPFTVNDGMAQLWRGAAIEPFPLPAEDDWTPTNSTVDDFATAFGTPTGRIQPQEPPRPEGIRILTRAQELVERMRIERLREDEELARVVWPTTEAVGRAPTVGTAIGRTNTRVVRPTRVRNI